MIALNKTAIPKILNDNAAQWLRELKESIAAGDPTATINYKKSKYNNPEIKGALFAETRGKCAYCESDPRHVSYGDIEHVLPKSGNIDRTFEWDNLTLACKVCNTNKAQHDQLIDPYIDDPSAEFAFIGPMIWHRPGRARAQLTHMELKLNRTPLIERRKEKIDSIQTKLEQISFVADHDTRELLKRAFMETITKEDAEFAAMARDLIPLLQDNGFI
jgi:uncharacterized protein (TIGR02646 family)